MSIYVPYRRSKLTLLMKDVFDYRIPDSALSSLPQIDLCFSLQNLNTNDTLLSLPQHGRGEPLPRPRRSRYVLSCVPVLCAHYMKDGDNLYVVFRAGHERIVTH